MGTSPAAADLDRIFGLQGNELCGPGSALTAKPSISRRGGYETSHIKSALVRPDYAADLQRALASSSEPTDWKLPDEDEQDFEVSHGRFELRGWLTRPAEPQGKASTTATPTLRGSRSRCRCPDASSAPAQAQCPILFPLSRRVNGNVPARAEQWADPKRDRYRSSQDI